MFRAKKTRKIFYGITSKEEQNIRMNIIKDFSKKSKFLPYEKYLFSILWTKKMQENAIISNNHKFIKAAYMAECLHVDHEYLLNFFVNHFEIFFATDACNKAIIMFKKHILVKHTYEYFVEYVLQNYSKDRRIVWP